MIALNERMRVLEARLRALPAATAEAVLGAFEATTLVFELHVTDERGPEAWRTRAVGHHWHHMVTHAHHFDERDTDNMSDLTHMIARGACILALRTDLRGQAPPGPVHDTLRDLECATAAQEGDE
jgi:hypothetical protein